MNKALLAILVLLAASTISLAQGTILPLSEVRPGMRGVGRTVFVGSKIEDFAVEVLGVVENSAPGQSIILAKISGGPLAETGVIQGMSGSPVYVDGRLMGAVALGFPMATAAICGIRPIEEMLAVKGTGEPEAVGGTGATAVARVDQGISNPALQQVARVQLGDRGVDHVLHGPPEVSLGGGTLQAIRTPVTLSGFSAGTLAQFAPMAERLGLRLAQGFSGSGGFSSTGGLAGSGTAAGLQAPSGGAGAGQVGSAGRATLEPGSMISVQLMRGQMQVAADGTVTHVDGNTVYAFGHRFLAVGATELPFARSEVITVLPNRNTSFKISRSGEPLGVIRQDRSVAIAGELGASSTMAPLRVTLSRQDPAGRTSLDREYRMEMVRDPFLAPLLLQMAVFSAVDATERSVGAATLRVDATLRFQNGVPPLRMRNLHAGGAMVGLLGALGVSVPAGYALQSGFQELTLAGAEIELVLLEQRQELRLEQMWSSTKEASPGEEVEIHAILLGADGAERRTSFRYRVPRGAPAGPLYFSAADAAR